MFLERKKECDTLVKGNNVIRYVVENDEKIITRCEYKKKE